VLKYTITKGRFKGVVREGQVFAIGNAQAPIHLAPIGFVGIAFDGVDAVDGFAGEGDFGKGAVTTATSRMGSGMSGAVSANRRASIMRIMTRWGGNVIKWGMR
jgi:hypothetical protein